MEREGQRVWERERGRQATSTAAAHSQRHQLTQAAKTAAKERKQRSFTASRPNQPLVSLVRNPTRSQHEREQCQAWLKQRQQYLQQQRRQQQLPFQLQLQLQLLRILC